MPFPLYIIKPLPDLKAFDALTRSSAVFEATFSSYAVEVLEHLMQKPSASQTICDFRTFSTAMGRGTARNARPLASLGMPLPS